MAVTVAATSGVPSFPHPVRGLVQIGHETLPVVMDRKAQMVAPRALDAPMMVSLGLPIRHGAQLKAFIAAEETSRVRPLSQRQFDVAYGQPASSVGRVASWLRAEGLHVGYRSPDGLMITATGTTSQVERALHVNVNQYRVAHRSFYGPEQNPSIPAALHVQTILGLDDYYRMTYDLHRASVRQGGFIPRDFRAAYDVAGLGFYGQGQTLGFTLYGLSVPNSDFAAFSQMTGEPQISSCVSCSTPGAIQWIRVGGANTDKTPTSEAAMDVEYGYGMAPDAHLRYYLAASGADSDMALAVTQAANDRSLHVVSNSWGARFEGSSSSFVVATTNEFMHAVAVGTTFYFSSGDNAVDSGCPADTSGAVEPCTTVQYPASSPYVVTVGGTNIAMNSSLTKTTLETSWSLASDLSGSGGGCNAAFARPQWQIGVGAASCKGRAEPDIAADGGEDAPANVEANGQAQKVWGTSLASPLVAGMAVDTNGYLLASHKALMGFAAPKLYRLANSPDYHTYFHDILCGYNGFPAGPGWDEVTGWGSEDWAQYTKGFAGLRVPATPPNTSLCRNLTSATSLGVPFPSCYPVVLICWPYPNGNDASGSVTTAFVDNVNDNFLRTFHSASYASHGFVTGLEQTANVTVDADNTPVGIWLASVTKSKSDAVAMTKDVAKFVTSHGVTGSYCADSTPDCFRFPFFTLTFSNGSSVNVSYAIFAIQNVVGETAIVESNTPAADVQTFENKGIVLEAAGIVALDSATNTPLTSGLAAILTGGQDASARQMQRR